MGCGCDEINPLGHGCQIKFGAAHSNVSGNNFISYNIADGV